jgi:acetolactate synthase-1/2/3 large subunit
MINGHKEIFMKKSKKASAASVNRRGFFKSAAGAAALAATAPMAEAQRESGAAEAASTPERVLLAQGGAPPPTPQQLARDSGNVRPPAVVRAVTRPGSDLMVQAFRNLGLEFVAAQAGSTFEGIQESVINYGHPPNQMPEFITALHEESAVAMGHGYAKAEGKPMLALLHGTIGLQHASMAIYNAYYDRVPIVMVAGNDRGDIPSHTALDMAGMVRSFTKWDAQPKTLDEALVAIHRAYNEAVTPPMAPTLVVMDSELQKMNAPTAVLPTYTPPKFPAVDATRTREIAKGLVEAQNPRIAVGRLRTPEGVKLAVQLAEMVGACTSTAATQGPMSFPQRHPLCGPGADTTYDYTLGLETQGAQAAIIHADLPTIVPERDSTKIRFGGINPDVPERARGNNAAPIQADAEASLPAIIEEVKRQMTADKMRLAKDRTAKHAEANHRAHVEAVKLAVETKRAGWNGSPVSTARVYAELWPLIMNEDWCLSSPTGFSGSHNAQLWDHNKPYSYLGGQGAGGMGYGAPASVGAALAAKKQGRIVINIQCDGDLNYAPGVLWTAAHHKLPLLTIMHNNRAWHQEYMYVAYMAGVRGRGEDRAYIGSTLRDPYIDYTKMAAGYGMDGEGPLTDPTKLSAALKRGVDSVKRGEPYMIDVVTQPR